MTITLRMGMTLVTYDGYINQVLKDASYAEQLGYDEVWFGDVGAPRTRAKLRLYAVFRLP